MAQQTRNEESGAGETIAAALEKAVREVSGEPAASNPGGGEISAGQLTANASKSSSGGSGSSVLGTVLKSAFGAVPLVGALFSLFGGGDSETTPEFEKYQMPETLNFNGATTGRGIGTVDYDQTGAARLYGNTTASRGTGAGGSAQGNGTGQQITVNVQAMDARSFLDHSSEIAQAVREAMLNSSSLNDVVSEL
jgi:hypothetical protein